MYLIALTIIVIFRTLDIVLLLRRQFCTVHFILNVYWHGICHESNGIYNNKVSTGCSTMVLCICGRDYSNISLHVVGFTIVL